MFGFLLSPTYPELTKMTLRHSHTWEFPKLLNVYWQIRLASIKLKDDPGRLVDACLHTQVEDLLQTVE